MKRRITNVNSPQPFTLPSAASAVGCSPSTLRGYVRRGDVTPQRTPSGTMIFFAKDIEAARQIYERRNNRVIA